MENAVGRVGVVPARWDFGLVWQRLVRWQDNGPSPRLRVRLVFSRPYIAVFKLSAIGLVRQVNELFWLELK